MVLAATIGFAGRSQLGLYLSMRDLGVLFLHCFKLLSRVTQVLHLAADPGVGSQISGCTEGADCRKGSGESLVAPVTQHSSLPWAAILRFYGWSTCVPFSTRCQYKSAASAEDPGRLFTQYQGFEPSPSRHSCPGRHERKEPGGYLRSESS